MATPNVGILTTDGKALIDKVNSGQAKISFSKIVFSSMDNSQLSDMQVKALTAIAPQEVVVSSPETTLDTNSGETRIRATGTNEALTDGVYVKTYAVYAKDDSGNEILYGITVSPNPNYLPEYDGVTPQAVTYSYKVNISNTSNITFTNSNDVYVSDTDLAEAIQPYAKTVDVNQQLATKVTDNKDGTITANSSIYDLSKSGLTPLSVYKSGSFNDLPLGTVFAEPPMTGGPDTIHSFTTTTFLSSEFSGRRAQIAIADNTNNMYFRVGAPGFRGWTLLSDDSKVVHSTDMRKPASDVAGIEEVNAKQDKIGYTPADDATVAHLSGANNFDTTPTVNNNPLLLASSLPSDLARTGSNQEFTGKNTFDTAPIDKTTGNPYITKDGVPSDVARTSQQTNFTAGLQSGGVDVATAADLKSVADSAWYIIPENNHNMIRDIGWMKRDPVNKYLYILYNFATVPWVPSASDMLVDLSSYVDALDDSRGYIMLSSNNWVSNNGVWRLSDSHRAMSTVWAKGATLIAGSGFNSSDLDGGINYLNLTTFNGNVDNNPWTNKCLRVHYNNWIRS